jgi:hypothetical protein
MGRIRMEWSSGWKRDLEYSKNIVWVALTCIIWDLDGMPDFNGSHPLLLICQCCFLEVNGYIMCGIGVGG